MYYFFMHSLCLLNARSQRLSNIVSISFSTRVLGSPSCYFSLCFQFQYLAASLKHSVFMRAKISVWFPSRSTIILEIDNTEICGRQGHRLFAILSTCPARFEEAQPSLQTEKQVLSTINSQRFLQKGQITQV